MPDHTQSPLETSKTGLSFVGFVLAVMATSNLFIPNITGSILTDPTLLALGLGTLMAAHLWVKDRGYIGTPHVLAVVLVLSFLPGVLRAADHEYGSSKTLGLAMTFVIVILALQLSAQPRVRALFAYCLAVLGVIVAVTLLTIGETSSFVGRTSVMGLNPIGLGRMASLAAMLCLLGALWTRGSRRLVLLAAAGVSSYGAMSTGSRAPLIAAGLAIVFTMLMNRRPGSKLMRGLSVIGLGAGVWLFLNSGGIDSSSRLLSNNTSGRELLWKESLAIALDHPAGIGIGNLYGHITLTPGARETGVAQYSHNMLLEAAVEGGWIALAGLLLLLCVSLRRLLKESGTDAGAFMLAIWVFAVVNASASSDLVGNRLMWVMIAVGLSAPLWRVRRPLESEPSKLVDGFSRGVSWS